MSEPGVKELAQRELQKARMARQHPLKKETAPRAPLPYAGKPRNVRGGKDSPNRPSKGEQRKKP